MYKVKVAELIIDFDLYPRNNVDSHNTRTLMDALLAGEQLPNIIADRKSKRVIDGVHRHRAYTNVYGPDHEIDVIFKQYKNEAAMFLDAMRYNASHGAKLDPCDRTHCIIIAERLNISLDTVAGALRMPLDKLGELKINRTASNSGGFSIPLKRTVSAFAGRKLTDRQVQANERLSGMNQQFYANQLIELIESKMLNVRDDNLIDRLRILHSLLEGVLTAK